MFGYIEVLNIVDPFENPAVALLEWKSNFSQISTLFIGLMNISVAEDAPGLVIFLCILVFVINVEFWR